MTEDYLRRWLAFWANPGAKPKATAWDWRVPATHPQAVDERKRIRLLGGPACGRELILSATTTTLVVPWVVLGEGFREVRYRFSGKVTSDYIEVWTPIGGEA